MPNVRIDIVVAGRIRHPHMAAAATLDAGRSPAPAIISNAQIFISLHALFIADVCYSQHPSYRAINLYYMEHVARR